MSNENEFFKKENDPLYSEVKESVTKGHRLPYKEYLKRRTIHYIEHVAEDTEIEDIKVALKNRYRVEPQPVSYD